MFYSILLVTADKKTALEQQSYKVNLLDADGFKVKEIEVPISQFVSNVDEKGQQIGFTSNSSVPIDTEIYKSIRDWELVWTTK